jgi:co-chaperonin GroES (HSP10)
MVNIKPLGSKVLVLPEKKQENTHNGLIIPVVVNKDIQEGSIILASPNVLHVSAGDKILYPTGAGIPITIDNVEYRFINGPLKDAPGDIIAITNQAPKANL